ncbi:MAG: glycosyltransferase family 1 protein [Candidatus Shapirobacteria bacterium]
MRIVLDARMYGLENAGIGRYEINLIRSLVKLDKKNHYLILLRQKYFNSLSFENKNFEKILADYPHYSWQEQIFLPIQLIKLRPDLVHFLHFNLPVFYPGKFVVTIHDLIKHESRGLLTTTRRPWFYWFRYIVYRTLVWWVIKRAKQIITPSRFWKDKINPRKTVVVYEGVDSSLQGLRVQKFKKKGRYLLCVGQLYPHKNVILAVKAAKEVKIKLKIACSRNVFAERFEKQVRDLEAEEWVEMLGFVSDEKLKALYQNALVFVFPSRLEGFGLTGLEAMANGCPVVAAQASCLPEIYGTAAVYFEPNKAESLIGAIKAAIANREKLIKLGRKQVKKYNWEKTARETIEIYENCFSL